MLLRTTSTGTRTSATGRGGFVIVAVLMVVVVLSLAAYQYSALMDAEALAAERIRKTAEARALAESGVHVAMAYFADKSAFEGKLNSNPYDNSAFQNVLVREGQSPRNMGRFSIVAIDYSKDSTNGSLPLRYGAIDEAGKININALFALDSSGKVLHDALMKLPNMTDEVAWSITNWINPNPETINPSGASEQTYSDMPHPYRIKGAPLDSIEELLFVQGVTPSLLFGNDKNRNGKLDPGEDDGMGYTVGWAAYLTVYSRERNVDVDGNPRINLNGNDLTTLQSSLTELIGQDLTTFILAYRLFGTSSGTQAKGGNLALSIAGTMGDLQTKVQKAIADGTQPRQRISSLFSLVSASITVAQQQGNATVQLQGGGPPGKGGNGGGMQMQMSISTKYTSPLADKSSQVDLLGKLLDKTTTQNGTELPAKININTAPREVLLSLPGLTEADADLIVAKRPQYTSGDTPDAMYGTIAWLLQDGTIPIATLQSLERYATARTQVYRVQSIGYFDESGPMARIEAVIDANQGQPRIVYYRDLTDLGRSIDPRNLGQ